MRIAKIKIQNFRSIESLSLEPGALTVFVGPNNCGKSNILAAIDLFFNGDVYADAEDYSTFAERERTIKIEIKFVDLSDSLVTAIQDITRSSKDISRGLWVTVAYERGSHLRMITVPRLAARDSDEAFQVMELILSRQRFIHIGPIRDAWAECSLEEGSILRELLAVEFREERPRGRRTTVETRFDALFDAAQKQFEAVGRKIQQLAAEQTPIGNIRFKAKKGTVSDIFDDVSIIIEEPVPTDIVRAGTGWQSSVLVAALRYLAQTGQARGGSRPILALEEPEAYLHPANQRRMMRALCEVAQSSQVFVSTHSTVVVDSIPSELFDGIVRVTLSSAGQAGTPPHTTVIQKARLSPRQREILQRNADVRASEVFFASAALLVEGRSDKDVFVELARKLGIDIDALGAVVLDVGGAGHFGPALQLCESFGVPWLLACDRDGVRTERNVLGALASVAGMSDREKKLVTRHANRSVSTPTVAQSVADINRVTRKFNCHVLSVDLEYALVNEQSIRTAIDTLSEKAILGLSPSKKGGWIQALDRGEVDDTLNEVRKYIGSKGLNFQWRGTPKGKKEHIPGSIAARLRETDFSPELKEVVRSLAEMASA